MIKRMLLLILVTCCSQQVYAQLTIEITQGRDDPTSIAIVPFGWQSPQLPPEDVAAIVAADLERTGQFLPVSRDDMLGFPSERADVFYRDWRALDVDYLLIGKLVPTTDGFQAKYQLFDVYTQKMVMSGARGSTALNLRDIAHSISDRVYEKLTGIKGAFSTKLLYVSAIRESQTSYTYRLLLSDVDGARERVILESDDPILTPAWSPDGENIAYVSFETSRPAIYKHNIRTNERTQLTNFKGLNGAPAWSPDGQQLAMVLSKDGSPDIYVMDVATRKLRRVTRHFAIDTEPSWMPLSLIHI